MDILKHVLSIEKFTRFVVMSGLLVLGVGYAFLETPELKALMAGYVLFATNVWVLSYLAGLVFNVVSGSDKQTQNGTKNFAMVLGAAKTLFLFVALYVLIGLLQLSGLYLFIGSLTALVLVSSWLSVTYLKFLSSSALKAKKDWAEEKKRASLVDSSKSEPNSLAKSVHI